MAKLNKQYYYNANHEKKLNCYHLHLSKDIIKQAEIEEDDELTIYLRYGKIIIEKRWHCTCMECDAEWDSGKDYDVCSECPRCHCGDIKYEENSEIKW